jgi:hypothetical protein
MCKEAFVVLVLVAVLLSLAAVGAQAASASVPKPSVPEFTLKVVSHSYDSTVNSPDAHADMSIPDVHVDVTTIEVSIENQLLSATLGDNYHMYYNVRVKEHLSEDWTELYSCTNLSDYVSPGTCPQQWASKYTVLSVPADYPAGTQLDFQVQAIMGHNSQVYPPGNPLVPQVGGGGYEKVVVVEGTSDWSSTQTVTVGVSPLVIGSVSPDAVGSISLAIAALAVLVVMLYVKRTHKPTS